MRLLVTGGRNYNDRVKAFEVLDKYLGRIDAVVVGDAQGADALAVEWARMHGVPLFHFFAEWSKYGKRAGPLRNSIAVRVGQPTHAVVFPGGKGTADMVERLNVAGVPMEIVL